MAKKENSNCNHQFCHWKYAETIKSKEEHAKKRITYTQYLLRKYNKKINYLDQR